MIKTLAEKIQEQKETISSATNAIRYILSMKKVTDHHKTRLLSQMIWDITEADGLTAEKRTNYKYKLTFISEGVKERRENKNESIKDLRLEHVFMKSRIIQKLLANPKNIKEISKAAAIGCIVTKEEHYKLPHNIKDCDGWKRYKKGGVRVWDTKKNKWKIDFKDFYRPVHN